MSLVSEFNAFPKEQVAPAGVQVELHPKQDLCLVRVEGTFVTLGFDTHGLEVFISCLLTHHARLVERASDGETR